MICRICHPQRKWSRSPRITAKPPCLRKRAARTTRWLQRQTRWKVPIMTMKRDLSGRGEDLKIFLIIVGVLVVLIALLMSLSATLTLIYDGGWHTSVQVLFIKKDIVLSQILSFILFPENPPIRLRKRARRKREQERHHGAYAGKCAYGRRESDPGCAGKSESEKAPAKRKKSPKSPTTSSSFGTRTA